MLELQRLSVHSEYLCHIVQCQDCIKQAFLNVMWPWLHDCNIPTHQQGISMHVQCGRVTDSVTFAAVMLC